jgi:hypothetical protein
MPSKSKSQQRFFGWVHACQKGTAKNCPSNINKVAGSISPEDAEDFARTKHKGLPERKKKGKKKMKLKSYAEFVEEKFVENLSQADRGMATNMTGNQPEVHQLASRVNMNYYITRLGMMMNKIEKDLGVNTHANAGEETHNWHDQAVQLLNHALRMAATGGKRQWNAAMQLHNWKKQQKQMTAAQSPAQMPTAGLPQQGAGGPTPLNAA